RAEPHDALTQQSLIDVVVQPHRGVADHVAGRGGLSALRGHGVSFMPEFADGSTLGAGRRPHAPCSPQAHCTAPGRCRRCGPPGVRHASPQRQVGVRSGHGGPGCVKTAPNQRSGSAKPADLGGPPLLRWSHRHGDGGLPPGPLRTPWPRTASSTSPATGRARKERTAHHGPEQHPPSPRSRPAPHPARAARGAWSRRSGRARRRRPRHRVHRRSGPGRPVRSPRAPVRPPPAPPPAPAPPAAPPATPPPAEPRPAAPTVTAPSAVLDSTQKLRWGSRGGAVQDLQAALNDQGANLAVDGVFGPRTHSAVKSYQSSNGLLVDGVVGPKTRGALNGAGVSTGGASVSTSSSSSSSSSIVDAARSVVGTPYSWGGSSLSGMDCSGLVNYAYQAAGIDIPRTSSQIANGGRWISQSQAQPGDIVAWPGHVAIYAGNGK